jgi:hypothetical protein
MASQGRGTRIALKIPSSYAQALSTAAAIPRSSHDRASEWALTLRLALGPNLRHVEIEAASVA